MDMSIATVQNAFSVPFFPPLLSALYMYLNTILEVTFFQVSPGYEDLFREKYFSEAPFRITVPSIMAV